MISPETHRQIADLKRAGLRTVEIAKQVKVSASSIYHSISQKRRVLVLADGHSGHRAGLTPPAFQWKLDNPILGKWAQQQIEMWEWYENKIKILQPIDILIYNADANEGKGGRSGGTELITPDRELQIEMAYECMKIIHAPKIVMTRGTEYHTGIDEDRENLLAKRLEKKSKDKIG